METFAEIIKMKIVLGVVLLLIRLKAVTMSMTFRQGMAKENASLNDLIDEGPFFIWANIGRSECALECFMKRCTYFYYNENDWLCNLYDGDYYLNLTVSVGWMYFKMEVRCPPAYTFRPSSYNCLRLYQPYPIYNSYEKKQMKCSEHGGELVKIDSVEKQYSVEEFLDGLEADPSRITIVIQGRESDLQYEFDDGTQLVFHNWGDLQPNFAPFLSINASDFYSWYGIPSTTMQNSFFLCEVKI